MARLLLIGGAYSARSGIANCQRCVNLFPEHNTKDAPVPVTHYQRPGLRQLQVPASPGPARGLYQATNGLGLYVAGSRVYRVNSNWSLVQIGSLLVPGSNPVSFQDNGETCLLVDGSGFGYTIDLGTSAFAQFVDPTGSFTGADFVKYVDTFTIWNVPGTRQFRSTLSNTLDCDALYVASKTSYPDLLRAIQVNRQVILLIGAVKTEPWFDAGLPAFPFARLPGAYFEHGTCAPYSVASADISTFFLGQDLQGRGVVFRIRDYECKRVSNHALEFQIRKMVAAGADITDAVAYCYQQDGHQFYVLTFRSGDQTWAFDEATEEWAQRAWTDPDGVLHRERPGAFTAMHGQLVVGDWEDGTLYALDADTYQDQLASGTSPVSFIRTFPHIRSESLGPSASGKPVTLDGHRVQYSGFTADIEPGEGALETNGAEPTVGLAWSDDRGKTFGNTVLQTTGAPGQYLTQPTWPGLGIARDRVFELRYSINGPAALNGAWVDGTVLTS